MPHPYNLDETALGFVRRATALSQEIAAKHAGAVDHDGRYPKESVAALAKEGLLGLCVARAQGGAGQGPRTFAAVAEELAQACGSTAMVFVMHVSAQQAIASSKTLADRDALLGQIAAGQHLTTLALSERGSRSQFWAPVSRLTERAGGFVTSAYKSFVTSANHADSYVSSAQKPGAASPLESTVYLARTAGEQVRPQAGFDGLGLRGNDSAPVTIEDLPVSERDFVSGQGAGAETLLEVVLPWFAIGTAGMSHGLCRAAVAATAKHMTETTFEHTGQALRDLPTLRARLAQMHVRTEASRALLGRTFGEMEAAAPEAPLFVLSSRRAALDAALEVTDLALKACGGAAFSRQAPGAPVERLFRDARAGWVMAPTVDHLDDFIGKALTGLPLF